MADLHGDRVSHLLVDARPVDHPTARNRGIGRYTIGLLSGLQQVGAPVVALYETDTEAGVLAAAVPGLALQRWSPAVIRAHTMPGAWYLATQLMLHPIPLDPVPRIITEAGLPVAAVMYDVIPERYPEQYQQRHTARAQVQLRGILTRTLDALLAISQFAADTAAHELRFPAQRIAMIGAGVEGQFMPATADPWPRLREVLHADGRAVVVSVVGSDPRKNTHRLLSAWGKVPAAVRRTHRLVVVGAHDDALLAQWQQWAHAAGVGHDVAFTGGVTDDEMVAVHQVAALAVMPSTEEGFGLPVLEAAACGCLVITSNVSSLPEVLAERAAEFDPYDVAAIAAAIERTHRRRSQGRAVGGGAACRTALDLGRHRQRSDVVAGSAGAAAAAHAAPGGSTHRARRRLRRFPDWSSEHTAGRGHRRPGRRSRGAPAGRWRHHRPAHARRARPLSRPCVGPLRAPVALRPRGHARRRYAARVPRSWTTVRHSARLHSRPLAQPLTPPTRPSATPIATQSPCWSGWRTARPPAVERRPLPTEAR